MRFSRIFLLGLCGMGLVACGDDSDSPAQTVSVGDRSDAGPRPGGQSGTGGVVIGTGGRGGSETPDDEDAGGMPNTDVSTRCRNVDPAPLDVADRDPSMVYNGVFMPTDLSTTRSEAAWLDGCVQPILRITLSDGHCPNGEGHELTFFLPADGVENSNLVIGQNLITEETLTSIRVRYTRPGRKPPSGTWGTCEDASGFLDIVPPLQLLEGRLVQGNFMLDLTRCDDGDESTQIVNGSFSAELPAGLREVCP